MFHFPLVILWECTLIWEQTRQKLKESYAAEFAATIERAEKQVILARHGRRLLNLLDDTPVVPGDTRPQFVHGNQARQILNDAEEDLREWRLDVDDVPTSSNMLDSNLMPAGNTVIADSSYDEEDTRQTINEGQSENTGTYLPHGTTIINEGNATVEPTYVETGEPAVERVNAA